MKKTTKDNKGITLIALIITIIVMLILISVATYNGIDTYKISELNKFIAQMQLLQVKVDNLVETKTAEELNDLGLESGARYQNIIDNAYNNGNGEISSNVASEYKIFTKHDIVNLLDEEDVHNDIMVNFTTREIVDVVGVEYDGVTYYTQYKLPGGQTIINNTDAVTRDLSFALTETIDGLNATIEISNISITNGTLKYKEENSNYWITITNYTQLENLYAITVSKTAVYEFKLIDNVTGQNSNTIITDEATGENQEIVPEENKQNIVVTNKPKTDLELEQYNYAGDSDKWVYAQKDDINYVWIPRFAYSINAETNITEIKFIKGNSNIATDNTYIDNTWNIHGKFTTDNEIELTGIWVSVENTNQTGLDMITLLNDDNRTTLIEI